MRSKYLLLLAVSAVAQAAPFAYVSNCCNHPSYASVIATGTGLQTNLAQTGTGGFAAALSPDGSLVYITNTLSQTITVLQESTLAVVKTIPLPGYVVQWMAFSPDGSKLYVTSADSATSQRLVGVNTVTGSVFAIFAPGAPITAPVVSKDGSQVFVGLGVVTGSVASGLAVLNANTLSETLMINGLYAPGGIAISPDGTTLYVSNMGSSLAPTPELAAVNETTFGIVDVTPLSASTTPGMVTINAAGTIVYVCEEGATPDVSVVATSTHTVTTKVLTGGFEPVQAAPSVDGTRLYVTTAGNSSVIYYNATINQTLGSIALPGSVNGLALSLDGARLVVPNYGSAQVSVIDEATGHTVANMPVGDMGTATEGQIAVNPAGTYAFVTNYTSNNLSVISTATHQVVATVPTGPHPIAVAVLPTNGSKVYVLNGGSNNITVVDGAAFTALNTITPTVAAGGVVTSLAADPGGAKLYVGVFVAAKPSTSVIVTVSTVNHATIGGITISEPIALAIDPSNDELLCLGAGKNAEGLIPINLAAKPPVVVTAGIVPLKIPPVMTPTTNGIVAGSGNLAFATSSGSVLSVNLSALTVTVLGSNLGLPGSLALDPGGAQLWVANAGSLSVSVYSAANGSALTPVNLSNPSFGIAFAHQ